MFVLGQEFGETARREEETFEETGGGEGSGHGAVSSGTVGTWVQVDGEVRHPGRFRRILSGWPPWPPESEWNRGPAEGAGVEAGERE